MLKGIRGFHFNLRDMRCRNQGAEPFARRQSQDNMQQVLLARFVRSRNCTMDDIRSGGSQRIRIPANLARKCSHIRYRIREEVSLCALCISYTRSLIPAILIPLAALALMRREKERDSDKALAKDRRELEKARKSPRRAIPQDIDWSI